MHRNLVSHEPGRSALPVEFEGLVRIVVDLPNCTSGGVSHGVIREGLWAIPEPDGRYVIDNIPFYARDLNYKDLVSAHRDPETEELVFDEVTRSGGHSTFRVITKAGWDAEQHLSFHHLMKAIRELGGATEDDGPHFFAIDVPPESSAHAMFDVLTVGLDAGVWDFEGPDYSD